jgi:hypothetical protein
VENFCRTLTKWGHGGEGGKYFAKEYKEKWLATERTIIAVCERIRQYAKTTPSFI